MNQARKGKNLTITIDKNENEILPKINNPKYFSANEQNKNYNQDFSREEDFNQQYKYGYKFSENIKFPNLKERTMISIINYSHILSNLAGVKT